MIRVSSKHSISYWKKLHSPYHRFGSSNIFQNQLIQMCLDEPDVLKPESMYTRKFSCDRHLLIDWYYAPVNRNIYEPDTFLTPDKSDLSRHTCIYQWRQLQVECATNNYQTYVITTGSLLAETSVTSPRQLFNFIIENTFFGSKYPKNALLYFENRSTGHNQWCRFQMGSSAECSVGSQTYWSGYNWPSFGYPMSIVVGGRHFWPFVLAGGLPFILYTYLIYHLYTLCIYTTIYIFGGPPATSKTRPPATMPMSWICVAGCLGGGARQCFCFQN